VVVAGPGTGKTGTIVQRMIDLLKEKDHHTVVSFVTFTRTSRRDTDRKLRQAVGSQAVDIAGKDFPSVSTLHRFAKAIVHRYAPALGREPNFSVLAPKQREKDVVISEVIDDLKLTVNCVVLERAIAEFRSTGQWPTDTALSAAQRAQIIDAFESLLRFYDTYDIEGLVAKACELLSQAPRNLPPVFLQVDEYQDLNPMDQRLVSLVSAAPGSQVVVVGDDAQSIYSMRHAHPVGIRELWDSRDWDRECFSECHRLPTHILRAAHSLIRDHGYLGARIELPDDDGRKLLTFQCTRRPRGTRPSIQLEAVARCIQSLLGTPRREDGAPTSFGDMMVLCPTRPLVDQAAVRLEETFGIPTRRRRSGEIPHEVWKLLLVLRMVGAHDSLALRQWLEVAGLSPFQLRHIRREAMNAGQSLYEYCEGMAESRVANVFVSLTSVRQALVDPVEFQQALAAFPCLPLTADVKAIIDEMIIGSFPAVARMIGYAYEKYGLTDAEQESEDVAEEDKVLVSTMHGAKGLEAEFVFVTGLNSRFLPFVGRDRDEEERVFYVALTRARQDVVLTFEEEWDTLRRCRVGEQAMSQFLRSIRSHLDIRRVTASNVSSICSA